MAKRNREPAAQPSEEPSNGHADNGQTTDQKELAGLRKMLAEAKTENDRIKQVQDIVFARGINRDAKEEQIIGLGFSPTQAAHIMMDKDDTDQHGNAVVRPGFTRDQRSKAARNVHHMEAAVKKQEARMGIQHTSAVDSSRQEGQDAGHEGRF